MIFRSVCSGIEAATVAWHPLGWRADAFAEIEPFPSALLAHHYPNTPNLGDMTKFKDWPDAAFDLLVGGTPCQSFSVAGLRKGLADPRGNLTLVYLGVVERYRPRWLVWENVPGVLSDQSGAFGAFLGGLAELGYGFAYRVLDAQYIRVDGYARAVPQRRRRVFVVGYLGDWTRAAAVLFERGSLQGHPAPRREAGKNAAPTLSARTKGGGGLGTDFDLDGGLVARAVKAAPKGHRDDPSMDNYVVAFGGGNPAGIDVATAQTAHAGRMDFESETFVAHALRGEGFDASEDGTGRGTPLVPICFSSKDHGADAADDIAPTLRAMGHAQSHPNAGGQLAVAMPDHPYTLAIRGRGDSHNLEYRTDGSSNAVLTPNGGRAGIGVGAICHQAAKSWRVRRLTPLECERLQGFPDGYTDVPYRKKSAADGPRYKALGNSMAIPPMRWIGMRIDAVERLIMGRAA